MAENSFSTVDSKILELYISGTVTMTPSNTGSPSYTVTAGGYQETVMFPSALAFRPALIAYFKFPFELTSGSKYIYTTEPQLLPYISSLSSTTTLASFFVEIRTDSIVFHYNQHTNTDFEVEPNIEFTYYLYTEKAS